MKEEIIKFETAKLAKEKSFNWSCFCSYDNNQKIDYAIDFIGTLRFDVEDIINIRSNEYEGYLAPTQSFLQKWLRETHNINMLPIISDNPNGKIYSYDIYKGHLKIHRDFKEEEWCDTYEQALEAGLIEALKLVK